MPSYVCKHPTCNAIIKERGYCDQHQTLAPDRSQLYDRTRRDKESKKFYDSAVWASVRTRYLSAHPVCEKCQRAMAEMVHHIEAVKSIRISSPEKLTDELNLMALCMSCHASIEGERRASRTY